MKHAEEFHQALGELVTIAPKIITLLDRMLMAGVKVLGKTALADMDFTIDLDAIPDTASEQQIARLKLLTARLRPEVVAKALCRRGVSVFEELPSDEATQIIRKLAGE